MAPRRGRKPVTAARKVRLGWREWVALPGIDVPAIKAKVDTGARTSALHAFYVEEVEGSEPPRVRFGLHPLQRRSEPTLHCEAEVVDRRWVADSGGHRERRFVIHTELVAGDQKRQIEVTLTNRETMQFRMLLGRTALAGWATVDAEGSYRLGRTLSRVYKAGRRIRKRKKRA